jgi:hypothetical protein
LIQKPLLLQDVSVQFKQCFEADIRTDHLMYDVSSDDNIRLRRPTDIVGDAVDAAHLVDDPAQSAVMKSLVWTARNATT